MADGGGSGGGGGGWADLSLDLFSCIFSKLSLPQLLRSAAVCVSWSANARELSTRSGCIKFGGQSPWLLLNDNPRGDPSAITFSALDERREYTIPVPDPPLTDRLFLGSAHGWIITIDVRLQMQLLNPITGAQIDLPRVFPSERTFPIRDPAGRLIGFLMPIPVNEEEARRGIRYIGSHWFLEQHHLKAILSADPSLGDGYTVALIHHPHMRILFTRSGDQQWIDLRNPISVENIIFHKGKLYTTTRSEVHVLDLDEAQIQHGEMPRVRVADRAPHRDGLHYLFETPRGDLLSIRREIHSNMSLKVERVTDEEEEEPSKRLAKTIHLGEFIISGRAVAAVEELGDLIVLLGGRNPLCLAAGDFPHLTPGSIYFTDGGDVIGDPEFAGYYLRMFRELNRKLSGHIPPAHILPLFVEGNWFRNILNCPIDNTSVRLYCQPPSSSVLTDLSLAHNR